MLLFRFTCNKQGTLFLGQKLLPVTFIAEHTLNKRWFPKPDLLPGSYVSYFTSYGRDLYLDTLYKTHIKYLDNIEEEQTYLRDDMDIAYIDELQVIVRK